MRSRENFTPFFAIGLGLTLAIAVTFQMYILNEPARIQNDTAADLAFAIEEGGELYKENCEDCHGVDGEGIYAPALNSRELLKTTADEVFFNLTRTGVPGTTMPAWGQSFGGPLTDEQVNHLTKFIRAWEPSAPLIVEAGFEPDPIRGATLFANACFICHGSNGEGTENAPAINDLERLEDFDDAWYRVTIANGRPARGMPTWGTVLSPDQISDLVALISAWREGQTVTPEVSVLGRIRSTLYAVRQFDREDAQFHLEIALSQAVGPEAEAIQSLLNLVEENRLFEAESLLISLFPPEEMGKELYASNCTGCHGADGTGGTGPSLHGNSYVQATDDDDLLDLILQGRAGTAMNGFEGILIPDDVTNLVALLRTWQE